MIGSEKSKELVISITAVLVHCITLPRAPKTGHFTKTGECLSQSSGAGKLVLASGKDVLAAP